MTHDPYRRDRRLGRWLLSGRQLAEYPGIVETIQHNGNVVILRAAPAYFTDRIEFMGRSPDFAVIDEGEEIPLYEPLVEGDSVTWGRADVPLFLQPERPVVEGPVGVDPHRTAPSDFFDWMHAELTKIFAGRRAA